MGLFVQVMLGVIAAIAVVALVGYGLFRRWIKRTAGRYELIDDLLGQAFAWRPPRLRLMREEGQSASAAMKSAWSDWQALGFRKAGDFIEDGGICHGLRLAIHDDGHIGLVLSEDQEGFVHVTLLAVTTANQVRASTSGLGRPHAGKAVEWSVDASLTAAERLQWLQHHLEGVELRVLKRSLLVNVFERTWAWLMDRELAAGPPVRSDIATLAEHRDQTDSGLIDEAWAVAVDTWRMQLRDAALDNWRRQSGIDAVSWDRLQDRIEVIDRHVDIHDIENLVAGDPMAEHLLAQSSQQGLQGVELFEAVQGGLPTHKRMQRIGEVQRPVPAVLYAFDEADDDDQMDETGAQVYTFEGINADGERIENMVLATSSRDAHRQIKQMGFEQVRIISDPTPGETIDDAWFDPKAAAIGARAIREPVGLSVVRLLLQLAWIWLPPALLLTWSVQSATAIAWYDWLIYFYALAAAGAMILLIGPMLVYHQLTLAQLKGRWRRAGWLLALLGRINLLASLPPHVLVMERCKILAGRGEVDTALAHWQELESESDQELYLQGLQQIHDFAGDTEAMIAVQQQLVDIAANKEMPRADLALSLARFRRDADGAEALLNGMPVDRLSGPVQAGYHYARGLILAERGQHDAALNQYHQAAELAGEYRSTPVVSGLICEINGYAALSLRARGDGERAAALWETVVPVLQFSKSSSGLLARWREED